MSKGEIKSGFFCFYLKYKLLLKLQFTVPIPYDEVANIY